MLIQGPVADFLIVNTQHILLYMQMQLKTGIEFV